jgi:hypothetical protein
LREDVPPRGDAPPLATANVGFRDVRRLGVLQMRTNAYDQRRAVPLGFRIASNRYRASVNRILNVFLSIDNVRSRHAPPRYGGRARLNGLTRASNYELQGCGATLRDLACGGVEFPDP